MKKYMILFLAAFTLFACKKTAEPVDLVGEWQLASYETKAVSIGTEKVDIWLKFTSDGQFELYQKLGDGRYRPYKGTYTLTENILSGKYSTGAAWGTQYEVSRDATRLTLTDHPNGRETQVFTAASIPSTVLENIY